MINSNPDIHADMYKINLYRNYYKKFDLKKKDDVDSMVRDFCTKMKIKFKVMDLKEYEIISDLYSNSDLNYGRVYDCFAYHLYLKETKIKNWAEKNQLQWREINNFIKIMSNGRAIHILRDPRAVMASFKKFTIAPQLLYLISAFNSLDSMQHAFEQKKIKGLW